MTRCLQQSAFSLFMCPIKYVSLLIFSASSVNFIFQPRGSPPSISAALSGHKSNYFIQPAGPGKRACQRGHSQGSEIFELYFFKLIEFYFPIIPNSLQTQFLHLNGNMYIPEFRELKLGDILKCNLSK